MMPAISIRQPFAWAIVEGWKDIENRDWKTNFRGEILIHAAKGMTRLEYSDGADTIFWSSRESAIVPNVDELPRGGIVGIATIIDCVHDSRSPWFFGKYGFVLANARPLPFVPLVGKLGIFNVPDRVVQDRVVQL